MALKRVQDIVDQHDGLARKVLDYSLTMKRLVDEAKRPGFDERSWGPLAAFVATEEFERVGNFMEVVDWNQYVGLLTRWATTSEWDCSFKRITEAGNVVFLELEERSDSGGHKTTINSVSVYAFDDAGLIRHLDIYLQMKAPGAKGWEV